MNIYEILVVYSCDYFKNFTEEHSVHNWTFWRTKFFGKKWSVLHEFHGIITHASDHAASSFPLPSPPLVSYIARKFELVSLEIWKGCTECK